ncbi:uncharacterized protein LOC117120726 [Anneissia japonica]|uniref:uncharacterized protein LOC117120726 n=1 Tax=Anneissia japonica TaxID=1529436 RepID=UPI001425B15C|nr:uncharacterized protein LOC117120726 [Anneissia japonica]
MAQAAAVQRPLPDRNEFESIRLVTIGSRFSESIDATIAWCRRYGLLAQTMVCPVCNLLCQEGVYNRVIDGRVFRCPNRDCRKVSSIRKGSFFEAAHIPLWKVIAITYMWSTNCGRPRGPSQEFLMRELDIGSEHTIVDWNQFCRDVAVEYFVNHPQQIGGPGSIVEIDESAFAKRKYNRGRMVPEKWVFGAYEAARKRGVMVMVDRRDAVTLMPVINQWIAPGSIIWSDMWAAYNQIPNQGFQHGTVNHTHHFVDPNTGVTTNHAEAMWSRAKAKFKSMMGPTNRDMIGGYLAEFMWNQRFGDSPFFHFWTQIANDLYVVN